MPEESFTNVQDSIVMPNITADIDKLYAARHNLLVHVVPVAATPFEHIWMEQVGSGGVRGMINLTECTMESIDARAPRPNRAKGKINVCSVADFIGLAAYAGDSNIEGVSPLVYVNTSLPTDQTATAATMIVNSTQATGLAGHDDFKIGLQINPDPRGAAWIKLLHATITFQAFAQLVFENGDVVVDMPQVPDETKRLADRLKLSIAPDLASLIAICNGLSVSGTMEATYIEDAHTGNVTASVARVGKASVAVPTAIVIAWEPLPGIALPVLLRMSYKSEDGKPATFTLHSVNLNLVNRSLAQILEGQLRDGLAPSDTNQGVTVVLNNNA